MMMCGDIVRGIKMVEYKTAYNSIIGEPVPWVFNGSHWNRIYGYNESRETYYVECPYCNTWVDVRDHCNCPNCTAPLHRNCLNKY